MKETVSFGEPSQETGIALSLIEKSIKSSLEIETKEIGAKIVKWSAVRVGDGRGSVSNIFRLNLEWSVGDCDCELPKSVILKLPASQGLDSVNKGFLEKKSDNESPAPVFDAAKVTAMAHTAECAFYNSALEVRGNFWQPKCYMASEDKPSLLILEDLSVCHFLDVATDSLNLQQCFEVVSMLAHLHSHCIQNDTWKSNKTLQNTGKELLIMGYDVLLKHAKPCAERAKANFPELGFIADRIEDIGLSMAEHGYIDGLNEQFGLPPVLVHGDLHSQNMAFGRDNNDRLVSIYDWQCVHGGSLVEDLSRFLCHSANPDIRRNHTTTILNHYYKCLQSEMAAQTMPFSRESLGLAFDKAMRYSTAMCVGFLMMFSTADSEIDEPQKKKRMLMLPRAKCLFEDCFALIDAAKD